MNFDREQFYKHYHRTFGAVPQPQVAGLDALLDEIEVDLSESDFGDLSYLLAILRVDVDGDLAGHDLTQLMRERDYERLGKLLGPDRANDVARAASAFEAILRASSSPEQPTTEAEATADASPAVPRMTDAEAAEWWARLMKLEGRFGRLEQECAKGGMR